MPSADLVVSAWSGESLDALLWRAIGTVMGVEGVLAANPGLSDGGAVLPEGKRVTIPAALIPAPNPEIAMLSRNGRALVQLWD